MVRRLSSCYEYADRTTRIVCGTMCQNLPLSKFLSRHLVDRDLAMSNRLARLYTVLFSFVCFDILAHDQFTDLIVIDYI